LLLFGIEGGPWPLSAPLPALAFAHTLLCHPQILDFENWILKILELELT